ncbi:uncharacterized protein LOC135399305 [Ornithodoros turicata]|uniref:uncharacterized protein LOC135399305 n=1 Tax=Ornithodoros turicata TaxID=34597 RepID=UPI00313A0524
MGKQTAEMDMVQCEKCNRWAYMGETPFQNMSEAEGATYKCKLCDQIEVVAEEMKRLLQDEQNQRKRLEEDMRMIKEHLRETEKRWTLLLEEEQGKRKQLQEEVNELQTKICMCGRSSSEREGGDIQPVEKTESGRVEPKIGEGNLAQKSQDALDIHQATPTCTKGDQTTSCPTEAELGEYLGTGVREERWSEVVYRSTRRRESRQKDPEIDTPKTSEAAGSSKSPAQEQAVNATQERRIIIAGDSNIQRTKTPILTRLGYDRRVEVVGVPGASTAGLLKEVEKRLEQGTEKTLVIVHVGLVDVLNDKTHHGVVEAMKATFGQWLARYPNVICEVCAVPRVTDGDDADIVFPTIQKLNQDIMMMCSDLGNRVSFLDLGWLTRKCQGGGFWGIHLTREGGDVLGNWLARKVEIFLGMGQGQYVRNPRRPSQPGTYRQVFQMIGQALMELQRNERGWRRGRW